MKIDIITICDFAKVEQGRLSIVDTRDILEVPKFPWRVYIGIAVKGTLMHDMPKDSHYILSIFNQEDLEVADTGDLSDSKTIFKTISPAIQNKGNFVIAGNIRGLIFDKPGEYIFRVMSSDGIKCDCKFCVIQSRPTDNDDE